MPRQENVSCDATNTFGFSKNYDEGIDALETIGTMGVLKDTSKKE